MKRLLLMLLGVALFVPAVVADNLKLSEFSIGSGRSAFTSGVGATARFQSERNSLEFTGTNDCFYGVVFWKLPLNLSAGICVGAFQNQIQTGPYVVLAPAKHVYAFYWRSWGFGKPDHPSWDVHPFFESVGGGFSIGPAKASLVWMSFMGSKTWLPGVSWGIGLAKKYRFLAGVDYKTATKEPLFWVRLGYYPK